MTEPTAKLRVLISGHLPPPVGGVGTYYKMLLNSRLGEYVDYRFVQTSSQRRELADSGRATFSNLVEAGRDCLRFTRALLAHRPQVVHIGTAFGLSFLKHSYCVLVSRLLGKRVLLHPHCSLETLYHARSRAWQWFFRQVIRRTDGLVVLSREWLQLNEIVPGCRIFFLPNAVDISQFHAPLQKHQGQPRAEGPVNVLYLGYLGAAKGTFDLLAAAALLRRRGVDLQIELVGSELTPGELPLVREKIITLQLDGSVRLNPPAYEEAKLDFFSAADIFVYPSHHEGLPMAILEAMACGLPVVAARVGGIPDVVADGVNGLLVDASQPEQLATALEKLAADPARRLSMQQKSFEIVTEHYGIDRHVAQLVDVYQTLAAPGFGRQGRH